MLRLFSTLRSKLFFCFFIFIFLTGCVAAISIWFYQKRDNLGEVLGNLETLSSKLTQALKYERDFFMYDTAEPAFYQTGGSENLARHEQQLSEALEKISLIKKLDETDNFNIKTSLDSISLFLNQYESTFKKIVAQIKLRGFAGNGLAGELQADSRQLERINSRAEEAGKIKILFHAEDDFIIRKDSIAARQLIATGKTLLEYFQSQPHTAENILKIQLVTRYLTTFDNLLATEKNIGFNYSQGLKKDLNIITSKSENKIQQTISKAHLLGNTLKKAFQGTFFAVLIAAILIGLLLSYVLTQQITQPLTRLSRHINDIAESGFTSQISPLPIESGDEVGRLTRNFNLMNREIHQYLNETTKRSKVLQKQNMQLQSINLRLISSENKLRSLNSVKDKFFSIISHDLKGPLHTLTGFLQILIKYTNTFTEEELREFAKSMDDSVRRLLTMLENLLQWSRSQTGSIEHNPKTLHLNQVLEDNVNLFKDTAKSKDIRLLLETENNLWVKADKNMLDFILRNLISNAIKFTRQGGEVRLTTHTNTDFTQVTVKDNGVGISSDDLKKLFQPDVHFSTPGTGKEKGTGFGLLLCKDFVEKNGGQITIESIPGKGTSLQFTVPNTQEQPEMIEK